MNQDITEHVDLDAAAAHNFIDAWHPVGERCDGCHQPFEGHAYAIDAPNPYSNGGAYLCAPCFFFGGGFGKSFASVFLILDDKRWLPLRTKPRAKGSRDMRV
jgi:hypothetical protein